MGLSSSSDTLARSAITATGTASEPGNSVSPGAVWARRLRYFLVMLRACRARTPSLEGSRRGPRACGGGARNRVGLAHDGVVPFAAVSPPPDRDLVDRRGGRLESRRARQAGTGTSRTMASLTASPTRRSMGSRFQEPKNHLIGFDRSAMTPPSCETGVSFV